MGGSVSFQCWDFAVECGSVVLDLEDVDHCLVCYVDHQLLRCWSRGMDLTRKVKVLCNCYSYLVLLLSKRLLVIQMGKVAGLHLSCRFMLIPVEGLVCCPSPFYLSTLDLSYLRVVPGRSLGT